MQVYGGWSHLKSIWATNVFFPWGFSALPRPTSVRIRVSPGALQYTLSERKGMSTAQYKATCAKMMAYLSQNVAQDCTLLDKSYSTNLAPPAKWSYKPSCEVSSVGGIFQSFRFSKKVSTCLTFRVSQKLTLQENFISNPFWTSGPKVRPVRPTSSSKQLWEDSEWNGLGIYPPPTPVTVEFVKVGIGPFHKNMSRLLHYTPEN